MKYNDFLKWVDVEKFANACHNISNEHVLNEPSNRFMKEKFILGAMQLCNHSKNIDWDDEQDYDLFFKSWRKGKIEAKTGNSILFSTITGKPKKTVTIKLKSIQGSNVKRMNLDKNFDHLMIIQIENFFSIGFVDYQTTLKNIRQVSDGFMLELTHDDIDIIYKKDMRFQDYNWSTSLDPKEWVLHKLKESLGK